MNIKLCTIIIFCLITLAISSFAWALEVDREVIPRITLGGRIITTLDAVDLDSDPNAETEFNLQDSTLLMRFDKRIYSEKGIAGAVLGLKETDDGIQFQQLHTFFYSQDFYLKLGRTRLPSFIIEFPTLRDDDLSTYTRVGNGSSNEEFDEIYGRLLNVSWFVDKKISALNAWAGTRESDGTFANAPGGINSYGLAYTLVQPENLALVSTIRHFGIAVDRQKIDNGSVRDWTTALIAGIDWNLNEDPSKNWSMAIQSIINDGLGNVTSVNTKATQAQADSVSLAATLRYTSRPQLLTRWQAALTLAYKDYSEVANATQWSIAPTAVYRLGQGIDLLSQIVYTNYDSGLNNGGDDWRLQFGIAFSLETIFNDQIGERDSILNLEHGYIQ